MDKLYIIMIKQKIHLSHTFIHAYIHTYIVRQTKRQTQKTDIRQTGKQTDRHNTHMEVYRDSLACGVGILHFQYMTLFIFLRLSFEKGRIRSVAQLVPKMIGNLKCKEIESHFMTDM